MNRFYRKILSTLCVVFIVFAMTGCSSTSKINSDLEKLQNDYQVLSSKPQADQYAPVALNEAKQALEKTEKMLEQGEQDDVLKHQLYVTERKIDIARESIRKAAAENKIQQAELRRKELLLTAREREVSQAKQQAQQAQQRALAAEQRAEEMEGKAMDLEQQVQNLTTEQTERGMVLTLGNVLFELDKAELKPGNERNLEKVASFLNEYPEREVVIEGFTDSTGEEAYNQQLSEQRADSVERTLVSYGVDSDRLVTKGYGEMYPVAPNSTGAGRQQNRRVEIVIANSDGEDIVSRTTQ